MSVKQYAEVIGVGLDAAYEDVRLGNIEVMRIGSRKIRIPVVTIEQRLGVAPGDLDDVIDRASAN
jgi:hypothetical protein